MEIPDINSPKILCLYLTISCCFGLFIPKDIINFYYHLSILKNYEINKIFSTTSPQYFFILISLSIHKKIEYLLPKLTTEVERREWDSNPYPSNVGSTFRY